MVISRCCQNLVRADSVQAYVNRRHSPGNTGIIQSDSALAEYGIPGGRYTAFSHHRRQRLRVQQGVEAMLLLDRGRWAV